MQLNRFFQIVSVIMSYYERGIYFCINHIYYSMVIVGLLIPVVIFIVFKIKKYVWPESSIVHKARFKFSADKKIVAFKKESRQKTARVVKNISAGKKYVLVPYHEWEEFQRYKKNKPVKKHPSTGS